jgi:hypothetical protein
MAPQVLFIEICSLSSEIKIIKIILYKPSFDSYYSVIWWFGIYISPSITSGKKGDYHGRDQKH